MTDILDTYAGPDTTRERLFVDDFPSLDGRTAAIENYLEACDLIVAELGKKKAGHLIWQSVEAIRE